MSVNADFAKAVAEHPREARSHFDIVDPSVWRFEVKGQLGILGNDWVGPFPFEIEGIEYEAYGLKNRIAGSQRLFLSDLGIYDGRDTGSFMRVFAYSAVLLLAMLAIGYGVCRTRNSITGMLASIKGWGKVFPEGLIHRWTFNKTLADDVCGKDAVPLGRSGVKWNDGKSAVILEGGQAGTSGLDLGENLIPTSGTPFTVEIWARQLSPQWWARIFEVGSASGDMMNMSWNREGNVMADSLQLYQGDGSPFYEDDALAPYEIGRMFHISLVVIPHDGGGIEFRIARRDVKSGEPIRKKRVQAPDRWDVTKLCPLHFYLGHTHDHNGHPNMFGGTHDASAEYDEVRIWNRVLSDGELTRNARLGPNELP